MASNRLKINQDKSEFLPCATARRLHHVDNSACRLPTSYVRNRGAYFEASICMAIHVISLASTCFYQLRRIAGRQTIDSNVSSSPVNKQFCLLTYFDSLLLLLLLLFVLLLLLLLLQLLLFLLLLLFIQQNKMSTEKIERNGNRTQTGSGKLNGVLCPCRVIRTLSLAQGNVSADVIALNRCSVMEIRWNKNEV